MSGLNYRRAGCQSWSDAIWTSVLFIFEAAFKLVWSPLIELDVRRVCMWSVYPVTDNNYTRMWLSLSSTREQSNCAITILRGLCQVDVWYTDFSSQIIRLLGADYDQIIDDAGVNMTFSLYSFNSLIFTCQQDVRLSKLDTQGLLFFLCGSFEPPCLPLNYKLA